MPRYATLSDVLRADGAQQQVVADTKAVIEQELAAKSGVSATLLKAAYKAVTTLAPGYYESRIEQLVPGVLDRLQPFWTDFQSSGSGQFGEYLSARGKDVSDALLAVTDERAKISKRTAVTAVYNSVRGSAAEHIQTALPAVGSLVEKYAA
ncbi:MAG TPA: hypothetical protein VH561_02920 [Micromonosporaceae bacterium]|jgi:hypothetical protein